MEASNERNSEGRPIIFLHGNPDTARMWDGVIAHMGNGFNCIAPDVPTLGGDIPPGFDYSLEHRAQWVNNLLESRGIHEPVDVVAHDHGGPFAMAFAVQHEARLRRLVISNTLFHSDYRWHYMGRLWRTPIIGELLAIGQNIPLNYWMVEMEMRRGSKGLPKEHIRETFRRFNLATSFSMIRLYRETSPKIFKGWEDRFAELVNRVPLMILWGDKDPYIDSSFADRFPSAEVHHFPDAGHWLPVEKPAEFAAHLQRFFSD